MAFRTEMDSMGEILVSSDRFYGAQTQRSIENFKIGSEKMPIEIIKALLVIKKSAAIVNSSLGKLDAKKEELINWSIDQIIQNINEFYPLEFPLSVWQTGSGTQTNMNVNEVIAGVANEMATGSRGGKSPIHPNDHVNASQSSNDSFPTAMNISTTILCFEKLIPSLINCSLALDKKSKDWAKIIKIGRTHMQDATPISLGQEFSAYVSQIQHAICALRSALNSSVYIAQGGTAVGTGLNCPAGFDKKIADKITELTGISKIIDKADRDCLKIIPDFKNKANCTNSSFITSENKFASLAANDDLVSLSGAINVIAATFMKIANDIRMLSSGPRSGIGEISLPENEPGSSIMPGKVNPTQSESMTMVAAHVFGNTNAIIYGGSSGHFQLNVFRPMIAYNLIQSINLLSDAINSLTENCIVGIEPNIDRIDELLNKSLMLVTALNPYIGYDNAAKIAKKAHKDGLSLKEAGIKLGILTGEQYDQWIVPEKMI